MLIIIIFISGQICRWCLATYQKVCSEGNCFKGAGGYNPQNTTRQWYDRQADLAEEGERGPGGIKGRCVFNSLRSFHNIGQTPPCIGHDLYEGVIPYDVQLYLQHVVQVERRIDINEVNSRIKATPLNKRDAANRPKEFKIRKQNSKYEGNAGSIRILSRILPFILSEEIKESVVGEALCKLEEVSQLVSCNKLSRFEIENILHDSVIEYLDIRLNMIEEIGAPPVKPKHHYLSHYSRLFIELGPLIGLWGMRMESKHGYFKKCIRTARNFRNLTRTCSQRHQRAQISWYFTGLFPKMLEVPETSAYGDNTNGQFSRDALFPAFVQVCFHNDWAICLDLSSILKFAN